MLEELDTKIITETVTPTISLSTAASDAIRNILTERNLEAMLCGSMWPAVDVVV